MSEGEATHVVQIQREFYLGATEVTQKQWKAVMRANPSRFKGDDLPVENVSWDDVIEFCKKLSQKEAKKYRLPTEAEWEYACRAGTEMRFSTGDDEEELKKAGWFNGNSDKKTHPVGQKAPNAWGLYDMHGNVMEWCRDVYKDYPDSRIVTVDAQGHSTLAKPSLKIPLVPTLKLLTHPNEGIRQIGKDRVSKGL